MDIDNRCKEHIYNTICFVFAEKRAVMKEPAHAIFVPDILNKCPDYTGDEIRGSLNILCAEGRVKYGHTINDFWFAPKEK